MIKEKQLKKNHAELVGAGETYQGVNTSCNRRGFLASLISGAVMGSAALLLLLSDSETAEGAEYCQWVTQCTRDGLRPTPCERVRVCRLEPDKIIPEGSRLKPAEKPRGTL